MLNKIVRYIVEHNHQAYPSAPIEKAWAQYNVGLDAVGNTTALSMAHHTASRYFGNLIAEYENGEKAVIKSYERKEKQS